MRAFCSAARTTMIVGGGSDLSASTAMTLARYRVRSLYLLRTITGMECYVIRGGQEGYERLRVLAAARRPSTLEFLELAGAAVDLGEFVLGAGEADLESFGLAEPSFAVGFGDAGGEVVADLSDAVPLGGSSQCMEHLRPD
jgi:hypothetical protein